jgi:hypothetical protein
MARAIRIFSGGPGRQIGHDDQVESSWSVHHFSQANPQGVEQGDVPSLLRRVADSIEELGPVEIQDLILHTEITADGPWPSLTVYFHPVQPEHNTP